MSDVVVGIGDMSFENGTGAGDQHEIGAEAVVEPAEVKE